MSDSDPDIEVLETEGPPSPVGTPPRFRELVALALNPAAVARGIEG